jgi:hypothetical protein
MLDDEIDEGVVGGSEGRGLHTQFPNSTFHMPKKKGKASGNRHHASGIGERQAAKTSTTSASLHEELSDAFARANASHECREK